MMIQLGDIDITDQVRFDLNDDECLPITKCVCGERFGPWDFFISIYRDHPYRCPACGRALYFRPGIRVYEVNDDKIG